MSDVQTDGAGLETAGPATETGFLIDGAFYEVPALASLDMDENQIMFELSGSPTEDWILLFAAAQADDFDDEQRAELGRKLKHPGFLRAMVHIAYRREHRDIGRDEISIVVGRTNQVLSWASMFLSRGDADGPPTETATLPQPQRSPNGTDERPPISDGSKQTPGSGLPTSSGPPDETPASIGTGESGTSSRLSALKASAA